MSIRLTSAAHALATTRAKQAVKDELRRRGEKVSHYAARDISVMAEGWLALHASELMPACLDQARSMIASGALGKRAQKALARGYDLQDQGKELGYGVAQYH